VVSKKVVVVDDEAHIRHIMAMKLSNAGYEVLTAEDGQEALEMCLAERPQLVITDYQMPLMTGLEMCRQLRQHDQTRQLPVLMLTARGFDIPPQEMASAGILDVLSKPFSPREVLEKVRSLIGQASSETVIEPS